MRAPILLSFAFLLSGCSTWELKARCENTNWFKYAQNVAFEAHHLEQDKFMHQCQGVNRLNAEQADLGFKAGRDNLCNYDEIYNHGKTGEPMTFEFCDGLNPVDMHARYDQGLKEFCTGDSGLAYGKSGKVYRHVCPAREERAFLPRYYEGRREYLNAEIDRLTKDLAELQSTYDLQHSRESEMSNEYTSLPGAQECHSVDVYNEATKETETKTVCQEAFYVKMERDRISGELSEVRAQMSGLYLQMQKAETDRQKDKDDLARLPSEPMLSQTL